MANSQVHEIFSAAGQAFTKLSELVVLMQEAQTGVEPSHHHHQQQLPIRHAGRMSGSGAPKWDKEDEKLFKSAVQRFAEDLNTVTENIKRKQMDSMKENIRIKSGGVPLRDESSNNLAATIAAVSGGPADSLPATLPAPIENGTTTPTTTPQAVNTVS